MIVYLILSGGGAFESVKFSVNKITPSQFIIAYSKLPVDTKLQ